MASRRRNTNERLRAIPLFRELSKQELDHVASLMTPIDVPAGTQLIREGDVGREFMIILEGTAVVRRKGRKVAEVGPGDFFGEVSVLCGARRNADVVATTDLTVEVLSRQEMSALLDQNAQMTKKILLGALARLAEVEKSGTS